MDGLGEGEPDCRCVTLEKPPNYNIVLTRGTSATRITDQINNREFGASVSTHHDRHDMAVLYSS